VRKPKSGGGGGDGGGSGSVSGGELRSGDNSGGTWVEGVESDLGILIGCELFNLKILPRLFIFI